VSCFWVNSCYLLYGRCLATSSCSNKTVHRRTGHARQSSFCNGRCPHLSHLVCGLRIAQISTAVDCNIWGVMQDWVYQKKVKDVNELKEWLVEVWAGLQQNVIDDTIDQWRRRLHACVQARGGHFEYLLWLHQLPRICFVKFVENFFVKQDTWFRLLLVFLPLKFHKVV